MCHVITATLPSSADAAAVVARLAVGGRAFVVVSNAVIAAQIDPGDVYLVTAGKPCDCGTSIGALARADGGDADCDTGREVEKLRRRGWSETKIRRWQSDVEHSRDRRQREHHVRALRGAHDAQQWVELLGDVLGSGETSRIGLLLHWYRGSVESERIELRGREQVVITEANPELLMLMDDDVLYEFVRG